ncbi:UTRA domain-containing protein, partial [Mycobacteroides abscessus]
PSCSDASWASQQTVPSAYLHPRFQGQEPPGFPGRFNALGPGEKVHVVRLRRERRTHEPLMITEAWLPPQLADLITPTALSKSPLYDLLDRAGVEVDRIDSEFTAELAGPINASLLEVPVSSALIRVNRLAYTHGTPHHYLSITMSPTRSRVLVNNACTDSLDSVAFAHDVRRT